MIAGVRSSGAVAMRSPQGEKGVGPGCKWAKARSAFARSPLSRLARRSTGARAGPRPRLRRRRPRRMRPRMPVRAIRDSRQRHARARHRETAPVRGAPARRRSERRARARCPENKVAIVSDVEVPRSTQLPSTSERGVSSAHHPRGRRADAQRVEDQIGDGGAVLRSGEAMAPTPILEHLACRAALLFDHSQDLNGR